jgi:hypothetical protein
MLALTKAEHVWLVADGPRHAARYCVICVLVQAFFTCTTGWYGGGVGTVAGGVHALPPSPLAVVPLELPDGAPPVVPEPLPLLPLELPDGVPLVLPEPLPLELPDELLPEPLLVVALSPGLVDVLLAQPLAYAATGTARHAMSPRPCLNFTAILP